MAKYRPLKGATPSTRKRDTSGYKFRAYETSTPLSLDRVGPTKHKPMATMETANVKSLSKRPHVTMKTMNVKSYSKRPRKYKTPKPKK